MIGSGGRGRGPAASSPPDLTAAGARGALLDPVCQGGDLVLPKLSAGGHLGRPLVEDCLDQQALVGLAGNQGRPVSPPLRIASRESSLKPDFLLGRPMTLPAVSRQNGTNLGLEEFFERRTRIVVSLQLLSPDNAEAANRRRRPGRFPMTGAVVSVCTWREAPGCQRLDRYLTIGNSTFACQVFARNRAAQRIHASEPGRDDNSRGSQCSTEYSRARIELLLSFSSFHPGPAPPEALPDSSRPRALHVTGPPAHSAGGDRSGLEPTVLDSEVTTGPDRSGRQSDFVPRSAEPVSLAERLASVDVLRGFALWASWR